MNLFQIEREIFISCPKFISPYLASEINSLGYSIKSETATGISITGTMQDCIKLNLNLRTAYRVLFFVKSFRAKNATDLYNEVKEIPWEDMIELDGYFSVKSYTDNETINDTRFTALKAKDAIADRFVKLYGKRPNSGSDSKGVAIYIHWQNNQVQLYIDTSGDTISKHGYRKIPFQAPMQESLAAAVIMASGWDMQSSFVNPMCGSGTLAIEAALMYAQKAPGLIRDEYSFLYLKGFEYSFYREEKKKLETNLIPDTAPKIIASDINPKAIEAARQNAIEAGVEHLITFELSDFKTSTIPEDVGVLIVNPEYGARLGDEQELEITYKELGDFFKKRCKGFTCFVFTGNPNLAKKIGLKASRRIEFFNSTIECRLLKFEMYEGTKKQTLNHKDELSGK